MALYCVEARGYTFWGHTRVATTDTGIEEIDRCWCCDYGHDDADCTCGVVLLVARTYDRIRPIRSPA